MSSSKDRPLFYSNIYGDEDYFWSIAGDEPKKTSFFDYSNLDKRQLIFSATAIFALFSALAYYFILRKDAKFSLECPLKY